jgi:hypothetical protein
MQGKLFERDGYALYNKPLCTKKFSLSGAMTVSMTTLNIHHGDIAT